jgi:hypothetical protein
MFALSPQSVSTIVQSGEISGRSGLAPRLLLHPHPQNAIVEDTVVKVPIVAMLVAASVAMAAPAQSQVNVSVNIGQPPPVVVARPVLVPVQASPVYYAPSHGSDLFFYDGRYYTVRDDRWYYATRVNTPWVSIAIGKVPSAILAVPVTYYRVPPGHMKHGRGGHCPPGQAKKGRC